MGARRSTNHLTCINCGSTVHWTTFQCDVCSRNPRERERSAEDNSSQQNPPSHPLERRKHPRYDFQGKIVLNGFFTGELIDLSQSGARFKTTRQLFRDEVVHLNFALKGIPIQVQARVVHVKRGVLDDRFTLGVCFEAIASDQSEILSHHLHEVSGERHTFQYVA